MIVIQWLTLAIAPKRCANFGGTSYRGPKIWIFSFLLVIDRCVFVACYPLRCNDKRFRKLNIRAGSAGVENHNGTRHAETKTQSTSQKMCAVQ